MNLALSSLDASDEASPSLSEVTGPQAGQFARKSPQSLSVMSDSELEDYIDICAEQLYAAHRRYMQTGCFADAGDRDGWWIAESQALVIRGIRKGVAH